MPSHFPDHPDEDLVKTAVQCFQLAPLTRSPPEGFSDSLALVTQQRLQFLLDSSSEPGHWIELLCRDEQEASRLLEIVQRHPVEAHPVSGEIELDSPLDVLFRRAEDLMQYRCSLPYLELTLILEHGGDPAEPYETTQMWRGFRILQISPYRDSDQAGWHTSIAEANQVYRQDHLNLTATAPLKEEEARNADWNYWSSYAGAEVQSFVQEQEHVDRNGISEEEYFSQYKNTQPEIDDGRDGDQSGQKSASDLLNSAERVEPSTSRAGRQVGVLSEASEAVVDHIGATVRSLAAVARAAGISSQDFRNIVQSALDDY